MHHCLGVSGPSDTCLSTLFVSSIAKKSYIKIAFTLPEKTIYEMTIKFANIVGLQNSPIN